MEVISRRYIMIRRILVALIMLTSALIPAPAKALVGLDSRPYFEWCTGATDLDCFESITFKYDSKEVTYSQPGQKFGNSEVERTNIGYIWSPSGFIGADGGNDLRLEASYMSGNLNVNVGGTKVKLMSPLPAACKVDPSLPCGLVGQLPSDLWISVTLRSSEEKFSPGFATANMFDPNVKVEAIAAGNRFTFSGYPMRIMGYLNLPGSTTEAQVSAPSGDYVNQIWAMNYLSADRDPSLKKCLATGSMILYTNAEKSNLPFWNSQDSTVEMRTQSSHFEPDGVTPFKGVYFARISDGMVKCLWSVNPGEATGQTEVTVVYEDGQKSLGTFSVTRKDGWLYVNGANFTYSSPTIKLKIKKAIALKSITCVKGKITKKVSAAKPKCPAGYKQK